VVSKGDVAVRGMKRVMGWLLVILGILLAVYPLGWVLDALGTDILGEPDPTFNTSTMVGSILVGGGLIWGGWSLLRSAGASTAAVKRVIGWVCVTFGILPALYPAAFVLDALILRIEREPVHVDRSALAFCTLIGGGLIWAGWSLVRSARASKTEPPPPG
jgi:hypothetical protein